MVKKYATEILAIDPIDREMKTWTGPIIEAQSESNAFDFCQNNGLGYCNIVGEVVGEIPYSIAEFASFLNLEN